MEQSIKNNKEKRFNEKGITLVVLVITIIIIIILSTVTINVVFGDGGLLEQAQGIKDSTEQSIADEEEETDKIMQVYANEMATSEEITEPVIPNGTIKFGETNWVGNGTATVTVSASITGMTLQYQTNSTTGNWTTIQSGGTITNLKHGDKVYARLYDGTNESEYEVKNIIDEIPPIVAIEVTNLTYSGVTLNVTASDEQSGLATSGRYTYYLNGAQRTSNMTSSYNYTGLSASTKYTLKVVVKDNAGKTAEVSVIITTPERILTVKEQLKEGDFVYYIDGTSTQRKCAVLYGPENANYSDYGIQIITMETLEQVTIGVNYGPSTNGGNGYSSSVSGYNNSITTLNNATSKYLNTTYASSVRCVGTLPDEPSNTYAYRILNHGVYPMAATENCKSDYDQLVALNLINIGTSYALASRREISCSDLESYQIWSYSGASATQVTIASQLKNIYSGQSQYYSYAQTFNIRPVFTLNPNLNIVDGNGTENDPYVLGV